MENYLPLLQSTSLFAGLEAEALRVLLGEVGAVLRTYSRGETLVLAGQSNRRVGVVLSGAIEAYHSAASGCCRTLCAPSATNTFCSPAG